MLPFFIWARGRIGPYVVVYFIGESLDGTQYSSGYIAKDGKILTASCAPIPVTQEMAEGNSTLGPIASLTATIPVGNDTFVAFLNITTLMIGATALPRYHGSGYFSGGLKSENHNYTGGTATFEYLDLVV